MSWQTRPLRQNIGDMQAYTVLCYYDHCYHCLHHYYLQECFQLSQQKVRMNLKQAEIMRDLSVLEARLRDRSQGLLAQEV